MPLIDPSSYLHNMSQSPTPRPAADRPGMQLLGGALGYDGPPFGSPEWHAAIATGAHPFLDWLRARRMERRDGRENNPNQQAAHDPAAGHFYQGLGDPAAAPVPEGAPPLGATAMASRRPGMTTKR